jgi:hypothetical protein
MIKAGDLVGWFGGGFDEPQTPNELDDFGVVVSIYTNYGFSTIRISWAKDPDEPIDEYSFDWVESEMEKGALVILSRS